MARRRVRRLTVGQEIYHWSTGHRHRCLADGTGCTDCREVVAVRRAGASGGLQIVFHSRPDGLVGDYLLHLGGVWRPSDDAYLNLNRPGVIRALLDEALARGWKPATRVRLDGWSLFDAVLARQP